MFSLLKVCKKQVQNMAISKSLQQLITSSFLSLNLRASVAEEIPLLVRAMELLGLLPLLTQVETIVLLISKVAFGSLIVPIQTRLVDMVPALLMLEHFGVLSKEMLHL